MKIDENDKVKVILTKTGADVINRYNSFLNKHCYTDGMTFKMDYNENDEFTSEFHTAMSLFYGTNRNGTEKLFKEIEVFKK